MSIAARQAHPHKTVYGVTVLVDKLRVLSCIVMIFTSISRLLRLVAEELHVAGIAFSLGRYMQQFSPKH